MPAGTLNHKDGGLISRIAYRHVTTAWNDCNAKTVFHAGTDTESTTSNTACATAQGEN